ncbi:oxidoreductase [Oleiphilus messinensis]|uniref:Oxidoreductase n=1 Tax=Oleiphilus messinensis TaxID=141451 RepID=A0A1Y0IJN0_9GAMM|nr:Gfo/Idh/MocA family oxidoreductase [Oleiphilus messinensis]ARU59574.1 oxidoreductase [Oleiphilus messinensis]
MAHTFLVVGLGSIGQRHVNNIKAIQPESRIIALRSKQSSQQRSEIACSGKIDHIIYDIAASKQFDIDAAVLCNPSPFHIEIALELAQRGIHLLIEKPISNTLDGIDELIEQTRKNNLILLTGYNFRYSESARKFKHLLESGVIGETLQVIVDTGQYLPDWRTNRDYRFGVSAQENLGGGVLLELSHEFDYLRWFFGEVAGLYADTSRTGTLDIDVEDNVNIILTFVSKVKALIHMDFLQRSPTRLCKVIGSRGTLTWNAITGEIACSVPETAITAEYPDKIQTDRNDMFIEEIQHFIDCMNGVTEPCIGRDEGKKALEIALAAKLSARSNQFIQLNSSKSPGHDSIEKQ